MPAKKSGGHASTLRWGKRSADELRGYLGRIRQQAAELDRLADAIDEAELSKVRVDGDTKLDRGLELVDQFLDNLHVAVSRARRGA